MSYQRAQSLKRVGLGSLIVNKIISGQGVGSSIRSSISEKTKAKVTRIKEKFDPINIGRAIGGRLGAYAVGRLTGRDARDINYFTGGNYKATVISKKTDPLVTKIGEGDRTKMKKGDGLANVLSRIYNLIKENKQQQALQHEVEHNLEKVKENQRKEWRKELIMAISGLTGKPTVATAVKEEKKGGMFEDIMKFVENFMKPIIDFVSELKNIFKDFNIFKSIADLFSKGSWLLEALASPALLWGALITSGVVAAYFAGDWLKNKIEEYQKNKAQEAGGAKAVDAQNRMKNSYDATLDESSGLLGPQSDDYSKAKDDYDSAVKEKQEGVARIMAKKGYKRYLKTGMFGGKSFVFEDAKGNEASGDVLKQASDEYDRQQTTSKATPVTKTTPNTTSSGSSGENSATTATPAAPEPSSTGTRAQSAISQNNEMNLEQSLPRITTIDNSQKISAGGGSAPPALTMDSSVMVRTDDSTLQNIFKKLARPV